MRPPRSSMSIRSFGDDGGVGRRAMVAKRGLGLQTLEAEVHLRQRIERGAHVAEHDVDQALDEVALDRRIGPAFDAHRRRAAAAAEQHVDDRVNQRAVDGQQPKLSHCSALNTASMAGSGTELR